jgi:hypothetical protein
MAARPEVADDDTPVWGARDIFPLYGLRSEKELRGKLDAGVIKVPKVGGRLCDTRKRAREQMARLLGGA